VELGAYRFQVFLDFREVSDSESSPCAELCAELGGRGTNELDKRLAELALRRVQERFRRACSPELLRGLAVQAGSPELRQALEEAERRAAEFFRSAGPLSSSAGDPQGLASALRGALQKALPSGGREAALTLAWLLLSLPGGPAQAAGILEKLGLQGILPALWQESGLPAAEAARDLELLQLLLGLEFPRGKLSSLGAALAGVLQSEGARRFLAPASREPDPAVKAQAWDALMDQVACLARASGAEPARVAGLLARWRRPAQGVRLSRILEWLRE